MMTFLAYAEPVPGRIYPLVPTFLELAGRGHRVVVRTGVAEAKLLRSLGIEDGLVGRELVRFEPQDWRARTRFGALTTALHQFGERAGRQVRDLQEAIEQVKPDAILLDETSWGAAAAAESSGIPWAFSIPSPVPIPSRDAPPFGFGLAPRHDVLGRIRDRIAHVVTVGTLERIIARHVNPVRRELGLTPLRRLEEFYLAASVLLVYTCEPFEYPRRDWPAKVRLVGPGLWEPPAEPPAWLGELHRPIVLVTCSTAFQNDVRLAEVACDALGGEPFDVVVTVGDIDASHIDAPPNVRIERYVPHAPVLARAACAVCHAGMGITQKALAHGVPVVAVPFGRDQPEVARRVEVAGAGIRLPARKLSPARLRTAVHGAMGMHAGAERIARAFAAAGGRTAAADALELLVRPAETAPSARRTTG